MPSIPDTLGNVDVLEDWLSRPSASAMTALEGTSGDILVLGAGGKMGPTLTRMVKRAVPDRRVIAVSRFTYSHLPGQLESQGIEVIKGDLLDEDFLQSLPDCSNVYYLAGMKFGATGNEPLTWAMNTWLPGKVCQRFSESQIVALSTGNVYGLTNTQGLGSQEADDLNPVGEYANSCLGRERLFQYLSRVQQTPVILIRFNYANELRYGVLIDLARKVLSQEPINLAMGWVNLIWQGDANAMIAAAISKAASPAVIMNVAGAPHLRVRSLVEQLGEIAGVDPVLQGKEGPDALLSDASLSRLWFGEPEVPINVMLQWVVRWLEQGGSTLGKPTKFENRSGNF
ncbi:MAG: NAD-dependent epimerase/dehydratase family protein [Verrucomicrobiaceae bacterium]|nr:NAD-dependent epimerase/dehydratase family protein [Verrucomicrobiaceae bacterium]